MRRLRHSQAEAERLLRDATAALVAALASERVVVFGPFARGRARGPGRGVDLHPRGMAASLGAACRRLDQLYIATRYPNGLPDHVPHDFYDDGTSAAALGDLGAVVGCVQRFVSVTP